MGRITEIKDQRVLGGNMTSLIFNTGKQELLNGNIDLINDSIKVALMTSGYSPDKDADNYYNELNFQASGTGYNAGGKLLSNKSVLKDDVNDRAEYHADDLVWNMITVSNVKGCVLFKDTGDPASSPLIAYIDFGEEFSKIADDFVISWSSEGILYLEGV
jgi:hypothetical protein